MTIKHVLACVDGSSGDSAVLSYSLQIARKFPVHVDVLHVRLDLSKAPKRGWYRKGVDLLFGATAEDFVRGPISIVRDAPNNLAAGFTVRDGNYLSARWPGDAHRFSNEFASMLG